LDRGLLLVAELVEEHLQRRGVAARCCPYDTASLVVSDAGQEAMIRCVGDLVHAEQNEPVQPRGIEVVGDHARDDVPD
jgi:hypothetical protein